MCHTTCNHLYVSSTAYFSSGDRGLSAAFVPLAKLYRHNIVPNINTHKQNKQNATDMLLTPTTDGKGCSSLHQHNHSVSQRNHIWTVTHWLNPNEGGNCNRISVGLRSKSTLGSGSSSYTSDSSGVSIRSGSWISFRSKTSSARETSTLPSFDGIFLL